MFLSHMIEAICPPLGSGKEHYFIMCHRKFNLHNKLQPLTLMALWQKHLYSNMDQMLGPYYTPPVYRN